MGCCEKQTKKEAAGSIVKAHMQVIADKILRKSFECKEYRDRIKTCESCAHHTWLSRKERLNWIICNLGVIIVRPNRIAEDTAKLPVKLEPMDHGLLCCQYCRCVCDVKARGKKLECCLKKWRK